MFSLVLGNQKFYKLALQVVLVLEAVKDQGGMDIRFYIHKIALSIKFSEWQC